MKLKQAGDNIKNKRATLENLQLNCGWQLIKLDDDLLQYNTHIKQFAAKGVSSVFVVTKKKQLPVAVCSLLFPCVAKIECVLK